MTSMAFTTTNTLSPIVGNQLRRSTGSSHVIQNIGQQDGAFHGDTVEFEYGGVFDGHGAGPRKHLLRDLLNAHDWTATLRTTDFHKIDKDQDGYFASPLFGAIQHLAWHGQDSFASRLKGQGATLSLYKAYNDRFEFFTSGDSTIKLYANTIESPDEFKRIFTSKDHDSFHEEDMAHLEQREGGGNPGLRLSWRHKGQNIPNGVRRKNVWSLHATGDTDITMKQSAYIYYDDGSVVNMTSSIGHIPSRHILSSRYDSKMMGGSSLSLAQRSLNMETVERKEGVQYCLLIASDGLWDISHNGDDGFFTEQIRKNPETAAKSIAEFGQKRWGQKWTYTCPVGGDKKETVMDDSQRDDIGVTCSFFA